MINTNFVSQEVKSAIGQLWRSTVIVFANVGSVAVTCVQRAIYVRTQSASPEVVNSEPDQILLLVLWYLAFAVFLFFSFRNFIWRPFLEVGRSSLNREIILKICRRLGILAVPYALVFTVLLEIAFSVSEQRFAFLAILPLLVFWEWVRRRTKGHVDITLNHLTT